MQTRTLYAQERGMFDCMRATPTKRAPFNKSVPAACLIFGVCLLAKKRAIDPLTSSSFMHIPGYTCRHFCKNQPTNYGEKYYFAK